MRTCTSLFLIATLGACVGTRTGNPAENPDLPRAVSVSKSPLPREAHPQLSAADRSAFAAANRACAWDLYHTLGATSDNQLFSPYSISLALAMTYAGAAGQTQTQMREVLHFDLPEPTLHEAFNVTSLALVSAPSAQGTLLFANQAWAQRDKPFLSDYLDVLAVNYGAGMFSLDFRADPKAATHTINDWVRKQTKDHIVDLLPDGAISDRTRLVLTNALYLKAAWDETVVFDPKNTTQAAFHAPGGERELPMMHNERILSYFKGADFQLLELPYTDSALRMLLVLPDEGRFEAVQQRIDDAWFVEQRSALSEAFIKLSLPKWRFTAAQQLSDTLEALGMTEPFSDAADFSRMDGLDDLKIAGVYHQGFISVDEAGTEAAAAAAVVINTKHAVPLSATLTFDRPFIFLIYDQATDALLFVGQLADPS